MAETLTLLHTAAAHRTTFEALRDRIAPGMPLRHEVRADWLARAQRGMGPDLRAEIAQAVRDAGGPVICTCTTLGPAAEAAGAIRVDWPMMQAAAHIGGPVLLAHALSSTRAPSLELLKRALAAAGREAAVRPLALTEHWPLFEAGEVDAFDAAVADAIRQAVRGGGETGCVVLAQASMAGAAPLLADLGAPVLASPELALRAALGGM